MTTPQYLIEDTPEELAAAAARQAAWAQRILKHERCSHEAEAKAVPAFARLLDLAETRNSGQIRTVVQFIAATYNGRAWRFDPFDLRGLDVAIGLLGLPTLGDLGSLPLGAQRRCADPGHAASLGPHRCGAVIWHLNFARAAA